jgi:phospholipase C
MFYEWTAKNGKENVVPISQFYSDAKAGALPQFTWINPECCSYMSMHPPSPINMGENFVKSIYEAVRNSPQWNETLFILTWDEHGGFADHVSPPTDVPAGDSLTYTETARDGEPYTFHFDRLGIRVPTVLISPWVSKGLVQHKPSDGNEFTHTSILKFVSELWGLDSLSPRVDWSPSFGNLVTNSFRSDTPEKLPDAADF